MTILGLIIDSEKLEPKTLLDSANSGSSTVLKTLSIKVESAALIIKGSYAKTHDVIIQLCQKLFHMPISGVCNAISMLGIQAQLAGKGACFKERLVKLAELFIKNDGDINLLANELTSNEELSKDMRPFFDAIILWQKHHELPDELFEEGKKPAVQDDAKSLESLLSLTESIELEAKGGAERISRLSGVYKLDELIVYLKELENIAEKSTENTTPIAVALSSQRSDVNHTISIIYNKENKSWTFIDIDDKALPIKESKDINKLAELIFDAYWTDKKNPLILTSSIFTLKAQSKVLKEQLEEKMNTEEFKRIQEVTPEKARFVNSSNVSWLLMAVKIEDIPTIKALLASGADSTISPCKGIDALSIAKTIGNTHVIEILSC